MILALAVALLGIVSVSSADIYLPANTEVIEAQAFKSATGLGFVHLPEGLRRIETQAFANCRLTAVYIPSSVEYIAPTAFDGNPDMIVYTWSGSYACDWAAAKKKTVITEPAAEDFDSCEAVGNTIRLCWDSVKSSDDTLAYDHAVIYYGATATFSKATRVEVPRRQYSATIEGLSYNRTYYFWLSCVNPVGEGAASGPVAITTGPAIPAVPTVNSVTAVTSGIKVTWTRVSGATNYTIYYGTETSPASAMTETVGSVATATITGVENGRNYYVWVSASNVTGESDLSARTRILTLPAQPVISALTPTDSSVRVTWTKVTSATSYTVYYGTATGISAATAVNTSNVASTTITGLESGTTYYFWLSGTNASGESARSDRMSVKTLPAAPVISDITASGTSLTVSWGKVTGATEYTVYYGRGTAVSSATAVNAGSDTSKTISGLTSGTTYYFWVSATNASGEGAKSTRFSAKTLPAAPTISGTSSSASSITVTWGSVTGATKYTVYYGTSTSVSSATSVNAGSDTSKTISGLSGGTTYYVWVSATNAAGESAKSARASVATQLAAPTITKCTAYVEGSVLLQWKAISGATYTVYYIKGTSGTPNTVYKSGLTTNSVQMSTLDMKTNYRFAVTATLNGVTSGLSDVISVKTRGRIYRALLIGQVDFSGSSYAYRNWRDVQSMSSVLSSRKTPSGTRYQVTTRQNRSRAQILSDIQTVFSGADEDDVCLFFIASHGASDGSIACLPQGTASLSTADLARYLALYSGDAKVIVIIQTCYAGQAIRANSADSGTDEEETVTFSPISLSPFYGYTRVEIPETVITLTTEDDEDGELEVTTADYGELRTSKFYVLAASQYNQLSWGWESSGNVFTIYLTDGIGTSGSMPADSDNNGVLTLYEAYSYIRKYVDKMTFYDSETGAGPYYQYVQIYPSGSTYEILKK